MEQISRFLNAFNFVTRENKLSRAGAFLFVFSVLHALPNFVLLFPGFGLDWYQAYADHMRGMRILPLIEGYLALSFFVHIWFAARAVLAKWSLGWLSVTGGFMLIFLSKHLIDFRFADLDANPLTSLLPQQLKPQKIFYAMGIAAASLHVLMAIRPAWFFALDFRGTEISQLIGITRLLLLVSTILYLVPLVVI